MPEPREFLRTLFDTAVNAATPQICMPRWLPDRPAGRVLVVGAGKAAASMARVLEDGWPGPLEGQVIVPYGHRVACRSIDVIEAAHPVPDEAGVAATRGLLRSVAGLSAEDTVVCLISGGGSALLCLPGEGITLAEKQRITTLLLKSGAAIHEINCVRKKLSAIKGGKLAAAAAPATVVTLLISDVAGNAPDIIASGPTVTDTSSSLEALQILDRYQVEISAAARTQIETTGPLRVADGDVRILATSDDALLAAAATAFEHDVTPYALGDLSGDARTLAAEHARLALQIAAGDGPVRAPCVVLSGGETTVDVRGSGRGGRNGEYALTLALLLNAHPAIHALAGDTDGIDGAGDNAGSFVTPSTLARAIAAGIRPEDARDANDSYGFFKAIDDLFITGPTYTNVNDFRAIFIADQ